MPSRECGAGVIVGVGVYVVEVDKAVGGNFNACIGETFGRKAVGPGAVPPRNAAKVLHRKFGKGIEPVAGHNSPFGGRAERMGIAGIVQVLVVIEILLHVRDVEAVEQAAYG